MLRPELAVLLDAARSEAKSHDSDLNLLHLSAAVARRWPREYGTVFGEAKAAEVASGLAQRADVGDEASVESLLDRANGPDPISRLVHGLVKELEAWLDGPAEGTGTGESPVAPLEGEADIQSVSAEATETGSPFELPRRSARFLELVGGDFGVQGREAVVDVLLTVLGRRAPLAALIVGESGTGRTAFLSAFAARIADTGYAGPLAGVPVVRVLPGAVIGADRANALRRIIEDFDDSVVLAVDDIDVIAGMGGAYADGDLLSTSPSSLCSPRLATTRRSAPVTSNATSNACSCSP